MKKIQLPIYIFTLIVVSFILHSCYKEGHGGKASIIVTVRHHEGNVDHLLRGAMVMIKYGATTEPGTTADAYDQSKTADTLYAKTAFTNLYKGNYYIYATGIDSVDQFKTAPVLVGGGMTVEITKRKQVVEITLDTKKK